MDIKYGRLIEVTPEEKNQMAARLAGTAYRGEKFSASIWEQYGRSRLYINFKDGYKARSTYLDLNDEGDLELDLMGVRGVIEEVAAWIESLASEQQPAVAGAMSFTDFVNATRENIYGQDEIPF